MPRTANISVLGLYSYYPELFDDMAIPTAVEKNNLVDNIVLECAEMEVVYPNADFLKSAIGIWSKTNLPVWAKLEETLHFEYDPISNYDRTEEWEDVDTSTVDATDSVDSITSESGENALTSNGKTNVSNTSSTSRDLTVSNTKETESSINENGNSNSENVESVAGYNSENLVNNKKDVANGSTSLERSATDSVEENIVNNEETETSGSQETTINDSATASVEREISNTVSSINKTVNSKTVKHSARMFGNIGVTTTQEMIAAQRKVVEFNIISKITEDFKHRFCILVY